jgi:hypothetical protein
MKVNQLVVPLAAAALLLIASISLATQPSCDADVVADAKAAIGIDCPCGGKTNDSGAPVPWKNHGQYMKCVTHARKSEAKNSGVALRCLKDVVPCAANSSCGKSTVVACEETTLATCENIDPNTLTGTCANDPAKPCTSDTDCLQSSCFIADSADDCTASSGTVTIGNCCE